MLCCTPETLYINTESQETLAGNVEAPLVRLVTCGKSKVCWGTWEPDISMLMSFWGMSGVESTLCGTTEKPFGNPLVPQPTFSHKHPGQGGGGSHARLAGLGTICLEP